MEIRICNRIYDTSTIRNLNIANGQVFIDTETDYEVLRYHNDEDIRQAKLWLELSTINRTTIMSCVDTLIMVCEHFINSKEQCLMCPLKKSRGCIFTTIPMNWRSK